MIPSINRIECCPGRSLLYNPWAYILIADYQYLFSVVLDVDSLYKKTKVIVERRVRAGELSSDEEQRILAVLSYSYNHTGRIRIQGQANAGSISEANQPIRSKQSVRSAIQLSFKPSPLYLDPEF